MSIKLANLNLSNPDENGYDEVPEPPPLGTYSPLSDKYDTKNSNLDMDDATSSSSESGIWFHQAASAGSIDLVKIYVERLIQTYGADTPKFEEERDKIIKGYSPLHMAARYNRKNVVVYLLNKGAPIDQEDEEDKNTPLLLATKYNMTSTAKVLLERGADPLKRNKYGSYALHFAARRGNDEICELLLNNLGVHVNELVDNAGNIPLHSAMLGNSEKVVELLIQSGSDVLKNNVEGEQPIHYAAAEDAGDLIVLLAKGAIAIVPEQEREKKQRIFVNTGTNEMDTALHIAAQGGFIETVKTLVQIGASVNKRTDTKQTPLHLATINGHLDVTRFLVRSYANINAKDEEQMTPLHKACQFGRLNLVKFLIDNGARLDVKDRDGFTPIMCAVWKGQNSVIEYLIEKNANIRIDDSNSKCVLHLAIEEDHYETLKLLLQKGAESLVNDVDKDYKSVLHYAAAKGNEDMISLLLENGATLDVADIDEKTPLHTAAEKGNLSSVKCIAKASPGIVNSTDSKGMSPLHLAAANGQIYVCEELIELGAEISCRDEWNWTPLDYAARNGFYKSMQVLIDNDAPVDACDTNNTSPLHHASQNGHTECITMLLDNGASIGLKNFEGKTCLDLAVENFQKEACETLITHQRWAETVKYIDRRETPPMGKLIKFAPDIAEVVLNNSVTKKDLGIPGRTEYSTVYDFRYLDLHPDEQPMNHNYFGPTTMVKYRRDKLLAHPVTVKLINHKWKRLGRWVYFFSLSMYLLFVTLLTALVVKEKDVDQNYKENINMHGNFSVCKQQGKDGSFTKIVPWLTLGVAFFQIFKELCQAIYLGRKYLKDIVNWFEFCLYLSTFLFMLPLILCQVGKHEDYNQIKLDRLKWQAGAISILCAWSNLLLYLKRSPIFGIFVLMFTEVLSTLMNVLCVFSILIVAFALSFYSLFKIPEGELNILRKKGIISNTTSGTFHDVGTALVKTMVMMIGELEYRGIFTENFEHSKKPLLPYKGMSNFIFILFVIVMTIVVMNLLVGLAVGDIESVRKNAYIRMLRGQVHILEVLERTYPKFILRKVYKSYTEELPKNRQNKWQRISNWFGTLDLEALRADQLEMTGKEQLMSNEIEAQKLELKKQKDKMKQLTNIIEDQAELMKKIVDRLRKIPKDELKKLLS